MSERLEGAESHIFKVKGYLMNGGDVTEVNCENINEAESRLQSFLMQRYDFAVYDSCSRKLMIKSILKNPERPYKSKYRRLSDFG